MVRGGFHGAWGLAGLQLWQDGWRDRLWRVGMELGHRAALSVHDPFLYSLGVRVTVLIRKGGWQVGWACAEAGLLGRHSPKGRPDAIAVPVEEWEAGWQAWRIAWWRRRCGGSAA